MRHLAAVVVALTIAATASAARPYHLELEATPEAAFPYLGRFGKVDLHLYAGGVRGEALWLHGITRGGTRAVTVANPLARMFVDVQVDEISSILQGLAGSAAGAYAKATPSVGPTMNGAVKGVAATRHRFIYGKDAFIDVWTTEVIPPNHQFRMLVHRVVHGISPGTAQRVAKLPGTPVYVELNFRRFKKLAIVRLKKLTFSNEGEEDALTLGSFYVRASVLEKLFK